MYYYLFELTRSLYVFNSLSLCLYFSLQEAVKMMCSWQYINCIDLWVRFIGANFQDYDLQTLLYNVIQIINGVAVLFPGPRYLPLRIKCIQWLNYLSSSSGIFIPVASIVLDILEHIIGKEGKNPGDVFNHMSALQVITLCFIYIYIYVNIHVFRDCATMHCLSLFM